MRDQFRDARGMTLLALMIALVLLAIVSGGIAYQAQWRSTGQ